MNSKIFIFFCLLLMLTQSCSDDEDFGPALDENGLTPDITNLVPQAIIDEMLRLGMPIHGGANPPALEGTYLGSRMVLFDSNRPSDFTGQTFSNLRLTLRGQNNDNLSILVDYLNGPESGEGLGSFVVGDGCKFSIFVEVNSMNAGTDAQAVFVFSGFLEENGIRDFYLANFMIDNFGNPAGVWIENGEGRVIHDQDGFSEIAGAVDVQWFNRLPDCPCEMESRIHDTREGCGKWQVCPEASEAFHFGAAFELRWVPDEENLPGQQCTYDINKKLITSGIAAGSPDLASPGGCGYGDLINSAGVFLFCNFSDHCEMDVEPWKSGNSSSIPCWQYLRDWPANQGSSCSTSSNNPVSDIQHMRRLVGNMTCQDISYLMSEARGSDDVAFTLKEYLLRSGNSDQQPTNDILISMLTNWKNAELNATINTDDELVVILNIAIANLR